MPKRKPPPTPGLSDELVAAVRTLFPDLQLNGGPKQGAKRAFLMALATHGQFTKAADEVQVARFTPYLWMQSDPAFAEAVEVAKMLAAQQLESEAMRRAIEGVPRGVWYQGVRVGEDREYSDTLTALLLRSAYPDKYRENRHTTHELSPSFQALQQAWEALRNAPPEPRRELPPIEEDPTVIEAESTPVDTPRSGGPTKAEVFNMLDRLQGLERDPWDDGDEPEDSPGRIEVEMDVEAKPQTPDVYEALRRHWQGRPKNGG